MASVHAADTLPGPPKVRQCYLIEGECVVASGVCRNNFAESADFEDILYCIRNGAHRKLNISTSQSLCKQQK